MKNLTGQLLSGFILALYSLSGQTETATRAYIANPGEGTVTVIDNATAAVVANIATAAGASHLAFSPDLKTLYVTNVGDNSVSFIDTQTNAVTATIKLEISPEDMVVTPDGAKLYVSNRFSNTVSVIDAASKSVSKSLPVGTNPRFAVITPNGSLVYVINEGSASVTVIDTINDVVANTITVGNGPRRIAVSPDGSRAYVTNYDDDTVSVIDTASQSVISTITVGTRPASLIVTPDGAELWVANTISENISVINTAANLVTNTITIGNSAWTLDISQDGARACVAAGANNTAYIINVASKTVEASLLVSDAPFGAAFDPQGQHCYVTSPPAGNVTIIDTGTGSVVASVATGAGAWNVAVRNISSNDVTDSDGDGDGIEDSIDNCPTVANPVQNDSNGNGFGDVCEPPPILHSPNGGEVWNEKSKQTISWEASNFGSNKKMRIYLSLDNGLNWQQIAASTNVGSITWKIPKNSYISNQALLEICVKQTVTLCDISDAVFTINKTPVAEAGAKQIVIAGTEVVLNGGASHDDDNGPAPIAYQWFQKSGPSVTLNGADTATPSFIPTTNGLYKFGLIVNDGASNSKQDKVSVKVNAAP